MLVLYVRGKEPIGFEMRIHTSCASFRNVQQSVGSAQFLTHSEEGVAQSMQSQSELGKATQLAHSRTLCIPLVAIIHRGTLT